MGKHGEKAHSTGAMRLLPALAAAALSASWALVSCSPEKQHYVPNASDGETTPTMATTDVTTLISDSGYTRYKVVTPIWLMYEDAEEPFWRFPEGIELEQYDHALQPESNVECDSAIYYSRKRLWRLDGNVVMVNTARDSFLTNQLFWDQTSRKIYSDSFIHIVSAERTIEGYGFESDQGMRSYEVKRPTAILPADRRPGSGRAARTDSTAADSTSRRDSAATQARRAAPERCTQARPAASTATEKPTSASTLTRRAPADALPAKRTPAK